jgi:Ca-activated chloride channel family protein
VSGIEWLHPERWWLVAAALALVLATALLERRGERLLERYVSAPMLLRLARRPSGARRAGRLGLLALALGLAAAALMRPQSRADAEAVETREAAAEVMVVLDVSNSMLAEDAAPSRLERAKAELRDLLRELRGHRVGLIAFAGRAAVLCPLTTDQGFFRLVLDGVSTRSVTRGGTRIGDAIRRAVAGMTPGAGAKAIVLVTDGEDHESYPLEAAKEARQAGVRIIAIGFGAEAGAEVPVTDARTGERAPLRDRAGNVVRSRLDGAMLREVALATEGVYVPAGTGVLDLESIARAHIDPLIRRSDGASAVRVVRAERYPPLVAAALAALVAAVALGAGGRRP